MSARTHHHCPTCSQPLPAPILTECQRLVLEDVRANLGTSAKAIHERLSKNRRMHATSPNIWLGVLMEKGLVRREKGFRRCYGYWAAK